MGKYSEAAHEAHRAVEEGGHLMPCLHPANNLVYQFLLEARKVAQQSGGYEGPQSQQHLPATMKKAAEHVKSHPYRIHDAESAQEVTYVGPQLASIIVNNLFRAYPPEPPSEEELEDRRVQKAAIKQQQAQKRKPGQASGRAAGDATAGAPVGGGGGGGGMEGDADDELAGAGSRKRSKMAKEKAPKAAKEYIPKIGTANYAFLIVLLEAHAGPSKEEYLHKAELMQRAEASGLSYKPIHGDGNPAGGQVDPRNYYNGWSCFTSQLVNAHALAYTWSNPKKCALTPKGLDLAERLYRHAVESAKMAPITGIPTSGPLLFQLAQEPAATDQPHVPSRWEVPGQAGRPAGPARAVATAAQRAPAARQRGGSQGDAAAAVLSPAGYGGMQYGGAGAPAARPQARPPGSQPASAAGYPSEGMPARPPAGPRTGAAAIAATFAAAAGGIRLPFGGQPAAPPAMPSAAAYGGFAGASPAAAVAQQQQQHRRPAAAAAGAARLNRATAVGHAAHAGPSRPAQASTGDSDLEVIDLLDDEDDLPPLSMRLAHAVAGANLATVGAAAPSWRGGRERGTEGGGGGPADADVALMVEMGFSDQKARKALRRASNVSEAVDVIGDLSSDSDSDGSPAFHDANESLPEDKALPRPPPLGPNPAILGGQVPPARAHTGNLGSSQQLHSMDGGPRGCRSGVGASQHQLPHASSQPLPQQQQQQQQRAKEARPVFGGSQPAPTAAAWGSQPGAALRAVGHMRLGSQQGGSGRFYMGSQQSTDLDDLAGGDAPEGYGATAPAPRMAGAGAPPGVVAAAADGSSGSGAGAAPSIRQQQEDIRLPPIPAGSCFSKEYEVVFLVDGREQYSRYNVQGKRTALVDHLDQMQRAGMRVERRQLKIGDAVWVARSRREPVREYVLDFVVERKSVDDLYSSICSGNRYKKQKFWLRKCGLRHVYYLVEGDPDMLAPTEQKSVKTATASIEVIDKFRVLRTNGHQETFKLYLALSKKIEALYGPLGGSSAGPAAAAAPPTFSQWEAHMTRITKGNTTLHDVWALMLSAVPGLGPEGVQAVLPHYPTPLSLYNKYRQVLQEATAQRRDGAAAAHGVLLGLRRDGYGRGLGAEKARQVFEALFARGWALAPR